MASANASASENPDLFEYHDLRRRVELALPVARDMILQGIETYIRDDRTSTLEYVVKLVERHSRRGHLSRKYYNERDSNSSEWEAFTQLISGALALGIAQGLLLRQDVFHAGDAR